MTARRPAPICLTLTGAVAALALAASTWTMPADVSPAPSARPAATPALLVQAPLDVPEEALSVPVAPAQAQAAAVAGPAPREGDPPWSGLLYMLALLGTGLAAACRRDGA